MSAKRKSIEVIDEKWEIIEDDEDIPEDENMATPMTTKSKLMLHVSGSLELLSNQFLDGAQGLFMTPDEAIADQRRVETIERATAAKGQKLVHRDPRDRINAQLTKWGSKLEQYRT